MAERPSPKPKLTLRNVWFDPNVRSLVFQVIVVAFVAWFLHDIISNALTNLDERGINTGFGFLHQRAGFGIIQSLIPYTEDSTYGATFVVGLLNTLLVSILGIIFATIIGFIVGIARLSDNWVISKLSSVYVEILRNTPLLLQIFFWYNAVLAPLPRPRQSIHIGEWFFLNSRGLYVPKPVFMAGSGLVVAAIIVAIVAIVILRHWAKRRHVQTGQTFPIFLTSLAIIIVLPSLGYFVSGGPVSLDFPHLAGFNFRGGWTIIPELTSLLLALALYTSAFIAEIVRSGIEAVNKGQTEAAQSLALSKSQTLRLVIIPQAMRVIIPPLTSEYLNLTKNSSLATAIGYPELVSVFMGTTLNQTGQAIEVIAMTMAVYLVISLSTSVLMNLYNRKVALVER
ncbi:amino acid ABC transporter permease [Celerinatantimonas sp. MCCC 1A17872]|uniref:amino acid ABC transporter permease n=1 Tax=Celerinatantimonas sp. MCCC 1A17872 TaxID=3177514 RepID=UPI0038BEF655